VWDGGNETRTGETTMNATAAMLVTMTDVQMQSIYDSMVAKIEAAGITLTWDAIETAAPATAKAMRAIRAEQDKRGWEAARSESRRGRFRYA
jgi:hypothetical protein